MLVDSPDLAFDIALPVAIFVHGKRSPDPAVWTLACGQASKAPGLDRGLIFSDGGSPDSTQRKEIVAAYGEERFRSLRSAVLSSSMGARFVVGALSLFASGIKVFAPSDARSALAYLDLPTAARAEVVRVLQEMAATVGPRFPALADAAKVLR